jgi:protein SCO1/2
MRNLFITLILATVVFISCNNNNSTNNNKQPLVVAAADATIKYQCPMKCEGDTAYTTAGKCPVCEMDLEKVTQ